MKEKFIPGIYNYCDRWCERCSFTSRCRTCERTGKLSAEQSDLNNKAFWESIAANFKEALTLLQKAAEKNGFDINASMSNEERIAWEEKKSFLHTKINSHLLSKLCKKYQKTAIPFVKNSEAFVDRTRELVNHLHLGITSEKEMVHTVAGIGDCFEVIQWYLFFIDAKLQKALQGKIEAKEWKTGNAYQKDSDGSAKIALVAIERSMGAWSRLYEFLPSSEDSALDALSLLEQLKQKAIEEFPNAMNFKRPGFDD